MSLKGKVAIISGGAGSIGSAIAGRLARDGASVIVADLNLENARVVASRISAEGARASAVELDLRDRVSIKRMVETVLREFKTIDILVNCAGGSARLVGGAYGPFHEAREEVIDAMIDINLKGPLFVTHAVVPQMLTQGQGCIVNVASICGVQGSENVADYSAAKGGVIAFTKALAKGLGPRGIRVNCVSPGLVPRPEENPGRALRSNYLDRVCTGEDIANLVAFLVSEEAGFITGQNYIVDGGRSLGLKGD